MTRKTQPVYDLVYDVLQTMPEPYGTDVIDDVCFEIENNDQWEQRYKRLCVAPGLCRDVVNNWIGQYVKVILGWDSIRQVRAKRSSIITGYTQLVPKP